jgi:hypothetical protein
MISNKQTMESIDGVSEETSTFLESHINRLPRAALNTIM